MSEFKITASWSPTGGRNEIDVTFCHLIIQVAGRAVTEFVDSRNNSVPQLDIPAYYVAEWIAENWWPLLWEPRKNEEEGLGSPAFLSRHSLLSAQHGFALPRLTFEPQGTTVQLKAVARDVSLASVRFKNGASTILKREQVEDVLRDFVEKVVARLETSGVKDTFLQDAWSLIRETDEDEAKFCRCAGALGLSPYDIEEKLAAMIERYESVLGQRQLLDLCLGSTPQSFGPTAALAEEAVVLTKNANESTLSPIEAVRLPSDSLAGPAYRRGVQAADLVRRRLGIKDTDPQGATKVLETLQVDTTVRGGARRNDDELSVTGAVVREASNMRIALLQATEVKRRFAGARAIFSAWSADSPNEGRLLTSAVTRDQQANRAFAAELTAPKALLRKHARKNFLSKDQIQELAESLRIGADVIKKNALNNGLRVANYDS